MTRRLLLAIVFITATDAVAQPITWQWDSLSAAPTTAFEQAMTQHQGVVGMDALFPQFSGFVGNVSVEKLGGRTTHFAILQNKRAHTGILTQFRRHAPGTFDPDDDVLMYILPNPGDKPYEDYVASGKTKAREIEGEIDVKDAFAPSVFTHAARPFSQLTGYGPFVHEKHNFFDTRPHDFLEIHPCENTWWSELAKGKMNYTIGLFSDNSGLFDKWRPNPLLAMNAIAFEFQSGGKPLSYTMQVLSTKSMVPYPLFDDHATEHVLMDGNQTIATIKEVTTAPRSASDTPNAKVYFSIDFARVSKTRLPNGKSLYRGFLKIHSAVKDGGHTIFAVQENTGGISLGPRTSTITVTLQSIRCISADDKGDIEEIYGAYGVSAVTGMSPFHVNVFSPGTSNGILWQRPSSNTLNLRKGEFRNINAVRTFTLPPTGELVISGDLNEEDEREGGDNDRIPAPPGRPDVVGDGYLVRIPVKDLKSGTPRVLSHIFQSGGTRIEALLTLDRKDSIVGPGGTVLSTH